MNCCDEYGNCNQGRNCPVREACYKQDHPQKPSVDRVEKAITAMLYAGAVVVTTVTAVACVAIIAWVQK